MAKLTKKQWINEWDKLVVQQHKLEDIRDLQIEKINDIHRIKRSAISDKKSKLIKGGHI